MAASRVSVELTEQTIFLISGNSYDPQLEDVDKQFHAFLLFRTSLPMLNRETNNNKHITR